MYFSLLGNICDFVFMLILAFYLIGFVLLTELEAQSSNFVIMECLCDDMGLMCSQP